MLGVLGMLYKYAAPFTHGLAVKPYVKLFFLLFGVQLLIEKLVYLYLVMSYKLCSLEYWEYVL